MSFAHFRNIGNQIKDGCNLNLGIFRNFWFPVTNDRFVATCLKVEQKTGACYHLSNCNDDLSKLLEGFVQG